MAARSATRPRSCTPAGRSACASCAPSSTWSRARARFARRRVTGVGLLGGTFNPPHVAHLICAQEALLQLGLERVLLVPTRVPPHKSIEADPGVEHRVAMCEAAVEGDDRLGVSRVDLDRPGPSYTDDTLRALGAQLPGDELTFIVGGDMAHSL